MARVKFNPVTGQYEVQDAAAELQKKADANLQEILTDQTGKAAEAEQRKQQVGAVPPAAIEVETDTAPAPAGPQQQGGQQPVQQGATPQIDVEANAAARQRQIAAQEDAAKQEQAAYQSSVDQYNAMVQGWQKEADDLKAQQQAAEKDARVSMLVAGIADGVAALTNLYFTTKGAPNIQLYSGLDKYREIYDKARQRREGLQFQINQRLQQGQLSLAQLRQQQAQAKAKSDAALGAARANADLGKQADILKNQQFQQEKERYDKAQADKDRAREDALAKDQRDFEYRQQKDAEDRQVRMQQIGLQYAARQDALNQRRDEMKIRSFTSRNGEDVSLDIDGQLYNFGYKPLSKQLVSVSESVYRDAKAGMQSRVAEIDKLIDKKGRPAKGSGITADEALALAEEKSAIMLRLGNIDREWENAKNGNTREVFASTYLNYSQSAKESLKRMSKDYEQERNKAYGIEDEDDDDNTPPSKRGGSKQDDDNTPPSRRK